MCSCSEEKTHLLVELLSPLHLAQSIFSCMDRLANTFTFNSFFARKFLTTHRNEWTISTQGQERQRERSDRQKASSQKACSTFLPSVF